MKGRKQAIKDEEKMVTIISNKDKPDLNVFNPKFLRKDLEEKKKTEPVKRLLKDVLPNSTDNKKEGKEVKKKSKNNSFNKVAIDKTDREICPVCGRPLTVGRQGGWCVNSDCPVLDDAYDYTQEKTGPDQLNDVVAEKVSKCVFGEKL